MLEHGPSRSASAYASMAKLFCTDVAMRVTVEAVQVFGGYGLSRSYPVERLMRDAKAFQIFDGTNQIQRIVIGRYLKRFPPPLDPRLLQGNGLAGVVA
jgi:alkylation response protein AidB-like acyl-CoA dehydrogenase